MIVFTMQMVSKYSTYTQFWIFIGFQWVVFSLQLAVRSFIEDIPSEVSLQSRRADFLNRKLIRREQDDDDDEQHMLEKVMSFRYTNEDLALSIYDDYSTPEYIYKVPGTNTIEQAHQQNTRSGFSMTAAVTI